MFDRTAALQPQIQIELSRQLAEGSFPPAVLFCGPSFSGKMTAAVEVATQLCGSLDGVLFLSDRNHSRRVRSALELYRKNRNGSAYRLLKESVTVMLGQYDPALADAQSPTARKKSTEAANCMETLEKAKGASDTEIPSICDSLSKILDGLYPSGSSSAISVNAVRSIRSWCGTSSLEGKRKVVVLEGLENASPGAVNALLKTIEEPPADTNFIVISNDGGLIPATILSRLRKYPFRQPDLLSQRKVMYCYSGSAASYPNLEGFFISFCGINDTLIRESAVQLVASGKIDGMPALVKELESNGGWDRFNKHLVGAVEERSLDGSISDRKASYILNSVSSMVSDASTYNQTPRLCFDHVVFFMKGVHSK